VPPAHGEQTKVPWLAAKVPAAHCVQVLASETLLKVPELQSAQTASLVAPQALTTRDPGPQSVHATQAPPLK
jgi:hypothetical protein